MFNRRKKRRQRKELKHRVFQFLDEHYPIKGNVVDISYNTDVIDLIENVFGTNEITFRNWLNNKIKRMDVFELDDQKGNVYRLINWY